MPIYRTFRNSFRSVTRHKYPLVFSALGKFWAWLGQAHHISLGLIYNHYSAKARKVQHLPVEIFPLQRYTIGKQKGGEGDDNIETAGCAARSTDSGRSDAQHHPVSPFPHRKSGIWPFHWQRCQHFSKVESIWGTWENGQTYTRAGLQERIGRCEGWEIWSFWLTQMLHWTFWR